MFFSEDPTLFNQWIYVTFTVVHDLLDKDLWKYFLLESS